jgi:hypothetical protein
MRDLVQWRDPKNTLARDLIGRDEMKLFEGQVTDEPARTNANPGATIYVNTKGAFYSKGVINVKGTSGNGFEPGTFLARMIILLQEVAHQVGPRVSPLIGA